MKLLACRLAAVAFVLLILMEFTASGQSRARIVKSPECPYSGDDVLLELAGPRIAGREVPFDKTFEANDDWLSQLVFRLTNRGKKPIAAITITVGLLGGVDEELPQYASYDYGLQFIAVNSLNATRRGPRLLALVGPGQEIEITAKGSRPYGLRHMDAILGGTTKATNWSEFASKVGARFQRMEMMGADVWFTDGSRVDARLAVRSKCDAKR